MSLQRGCPVQRECTPNVASEPNVASDMMGGREFLGRDMAVHLVLENLKIFGLHSKYVTSA